MILPPQLAAWRLYLEAAVVAALLAFAGWMWVQKNVAVLKLGELRTEFTAFKAQQSEAAAKQARDVLAKTVAAERAKEESDAENEKLRNQLAAATRKLRESNPVSGGSAGPARPGSKCPDGQTCFDTAEYQRADGKFVEGARGLADESTALNADLDTAKTWAQKRRATSLP